MLGLGPDLARGYAVVDLETTGLSPRNDLIIEIGLLVMRPGQPAVPESVLVRVDRTLSNSIVKLTGITDADLRRRGVPIDEALRWFAERAGDLPLVGHNVIRFDRSFLLEAARRHQASAMPPHVFDADMDFRAARFIDTAALVKGYKLREKPRPGETHHEYAARVLNRPAAGVRYNLTDACMEFRVSLNRARQHRAGYDAALTCQLFEALRERLALV